MAVPQAPNDRWSLDFAPDGLDHGRRFRILVIVDDVSRKCLAAIAAASISGARLARELDALIAWRGQPRLILSDNRPAADPIREAGAALAAKGAEMASQACRLDEPTRRRLA